MENPICNTVFDSRDLTKYFDYLKEELVDNFNEWADESLDSDDNPIFEQIDTIEELNELLQGNREEVLEEFVDTFIEEIEHLESIAEFIIELEGYGDFCYGKSIIHEDYFTDFTEDLLKDCEYLPQDIPSWIEIDMEATADNVKEDYMEVDYNGDVFYMRA